MQFNIFVNNKEVEVNDNETLLTALRRNGFKIPTLCDMKGFTPTGACRLCAVEMEGKRELVTSCSYPVQQGMVIYTNSVRVIKARKALVEMLLSNHPDDCLYCERNGNCELQWLAEEMNVKERNYFGEKNTYTRDHSSLSVFRDPAKCILCSRCIRVCEEVQLVSAIDLNARGNKTTINPAFNKGLNISSCINCGQCIIVCPTGALVDISHIEKTITNIINPSVLGVALISSQFVVSVSEHYNLRPTDDPFGLIVSALKMLGFEKVHDMGWSSDLNVILEARELLTRLKNKNTTPLISSCCPSWVKYAEEFNSKLLADISTVKSPQQLMGNIAKSYYSENQNSKVKRTFTVSFSACVANKYEASREENTNKGISEIDAVITVREFLRMLRSYGIDLTMLTSENSAKPFDQSSVSGYQTSYSGGKTEAVANQLNYMLNNKNTGSFRLNIPKNPISKKEARVTLGKHEIGFAWVSGINEAQKYLTELKKENRNDINYIEIMACTGGCANGGGQPISRNPEKPKIRKKVCQELERVKELTVAGENKSVEAFLTGHLSTNPENTSPLYTKFDQIGRASCWERV